MLLIKEKIDRESQEHTRLDAKEQLSLPFEIRQKARFVANLDSGQEIGIQIERGHILRDGDKLRAVNGDIIEIKAGNEAVSTIQVKDKKLLARVCYHLGNRHVQLQVESLYCRYLQDHVLDEMVKLLGADVVHEQAPFEPEAGAYAGGHHHAHEDSSIHQSHRPESVDAADIHGFTAL